MTSDDDRPEVVADPTAPQAETMLELALIAAGCRYLREHPEALREPSRGTPGGPGCG